MLRDSLFQDENGDKRQLDMCPSWLKYSSCVKKITKI